MLVLGVGCVILLWHSLDLLLTAVGFWKVVCSAAFFSWKRCCLSAARLYADGDFFFFPVLGFTGNEEMTLSSILARILHFTKRATVS